MSIPCWHVINTRRKRKVAAQRLAAHLRGGSGDEPLAETSVAGPADFTTEHDSRVRCSRRLGSLPSHSTSQSEVEPERKCFTRESGDVETLSEADSQCWILLAHEFAIANVQGTIGDLGVPDSVVESD